ncbi:MAG: hypothetical protein JW870_11220 [Candidatus Delongbacteria bacterium]|nr:hypothetical protein [Candidatus Delongbacteria bacterium]
MIFGYIIFHRGIEIRNIIIWFFIFFLACSDQDQLTIYNITTNIALDVNGSLPDNSILAIVDIVDSGTKKKYITSDLITENLCVDLFKMRADLKILERNLVDQALKELKFESTDLFDQNTIKEIGRFLGVGYIISGQVHYAEGKKILVIRCLDPETLVSIAWSRQEINF